MKLSQQFATRLTLFLNKGPSIFSRTIEIKDKYMTVYLRVFRRHMGISLPLKLVNTIEIARVDVKPQYQGKGLYRHLLQVVDNYNDEFCIYIENVQLPEHHSIYERRGFELVPVHGLAGYSQWPRSFFKMPIAAKEIP